MVKKIDLDYYVDNILKEIKKDSVNTKLKCKVCGTMVKDMILNGDFHCPICYTTIFEKFFNEENKFVTLFDAKFLHKLINLKTLNYKGKRPIYSQSYYDLENTINELNVEMEVSLTEEDYKRCDTLKSAIEELLSRKNQLRRKING